MKEIVLAVSIGVAAALMTFASQTRITVLEQDPQASNPLSHLNFTVGGSICPQFQNITSDDGKDGYKHDGFDGGTRLRFTADYYLSNDISWVGHYKLGVNFLTMLSWDNHYTDGVNGTTRRILYTGLKSAAWGTLTLGQQNSIYYNIAGAKADIQNYDTVGQAPGNDINGDYDDSYRTRKSLKYKGTVGDMDLCTSYLFSDGYSPSNGLRYKRKGGSSLGVDYHITDDLTRGTAWSCICVEMRSSTSKAYDQNIVGTALNWKPDSWTFSIGGGWYQDFITTEKVSVNDYFADDTWGLEYSAGYTFSVDQYVLESVQPYLMGDRIEHANGRNYLYTDNDVGIGFQLDYGSRVDYKHVSTPGANNLGDVNLARLRYDFQSNICHPIYSRLSGLRKLLQAG